MGHLYGDPIEVRGADGAVVTLRREPDPGVGGTAADIVDQTAQHGELVLGVGGKDAAREHAHRDPTLIATPFPARPRRAAPRWSRHAA